MNTVFHFDAEARVDAIATALRSDGWCVQPNFFDDEATATLFADCQRQRDAFTAAAVGRSNAREQLPAQRDDTTLWLRDDATAVQRDFLRMMNALGSALNQRLYLGLHSYEAHYAHYAKSAFYRRHLDTFALTPAHETAPRRILSSVCYLNTNAAGGELVLWQGEGELIRIAPTAGTAVFFLSAEFPHEVLPAQSDRFSIAGWFRGR